MFGVGENPVYLERLARQNSRREASGEALREQEDSRRAELIDNLFDEPKEDDGGSPTQGTREEPMADAFSSFDAEALLNEKDETKLTETSIQTSEPDPEPAEQTMSEQDQAFDILFAEPGPIDDNLD